jgi:hypothetical protein
VAADLPSYVHSQCCYYCWVKLKRCTLLLWAISRLICCFSQDVMNQFFTDREDPEGAMWHSLLYTFVGLGALATMAAVR